MLIYYKYGFINKDAIYNFYEKYLAEYYYHDAFATELCPKLAYLEFANYKESKKYYTASEINNNQELCHFVKHIFQTYKPKSEYYYSMPQSLKETNWKETITIMIRRFYNN